MASTNGGRPASVYDNLSDSDPERPRQVALLMTTTVPQNMSKAGRLGGRHVPTRSSLRHSRMIVLSKQGKVPRKYLPRVLKSHKVAASLLALKLLVGVAICTVAGWLLVWAPHLPLADVHHWSGLPALLSSVIGLILVCSCRKEYPGMPLACYVFAFKVISMLVAAAAGACCLAAAALAGLHLGRLYSADCRPANVLNAPCHCTIPPENLAPPDSWIGWPRPWQHTYQDLNCPEVTNILSVLLIATMSANFIAACLSFWYLFLHWESRFSRFYSQVQTSENHPIVITNKM